MKQTYEKFNPRPKPWSQALERWVISSPAMQYLMKTNEELARNAGIKPTVMLHDPKHPDHQKWIQQDPKHAALVMTNKNQPNKLNKEEPNFFLKLVVKLVASYFILPMMLLNARIKRNISQPRDEKERHREHVTADQSSQQTNSTQTKQSSEKESRIAAVSQIEMTRRTNNIKRKAEIKRGNNEVLNHTTVGALSPVSSIKPPTSISGPKPQPNKSTEEENALRNSSRKPYSTKPKDPTEL